MPLDVILVPGVIAWIIGTYAYGLYKVFVKKHKFSSVFTNKHSYNSWNDDWRYNPAYYYLAGNIFHSNSFSYLSSMSED